MDIYNNITHPASYSEPNRIKRHTVNKTIDQVKNELSHSLSYSIHKNPKKPRIFNPYFVYNVGDQMEIDLLVKLRTSAHNHGYKYILMAVDIFSRQLQCEPIKSKTARDTLEAFKVILKRFQFKPKRIGMDEGKEFKASFKNYLNNENIKIYHPHGTFKCAIVERLNGSFQGIIAKYLTANNTLNYIDVLQQLKEIYNSRYHSKIKMSPNRARTSEVKHLVRQAHEIHYAKAINAKRRIKYKVGQIVRIQLTKKVFRRGYQQQYSDELYEVEQVMKDLPVVTYNLRALHDGVFIVGRFYSEELSLFSVDKKKSI